MLHPRPLLPGAWRIGRFTLHPGLDEIELDGQRRKLEPRLTQVLLALCANPGEVVGSQALHDQVWGRVRVTSGSIYEAIARLRQLLSADERTPVYIATVPRRGYRLVASVARAAADKSAGPRLAVLPFRAVGLGNRLSALRERLLEGLIAALSRHTPCTVMARGSVLALSDGPDLIGQVAQVFGARYVVDGSIVAQGSGLRIRAELIDAQSHELLWTDAVPSPPLDGPELSGPVVERLARALELQLMSALASDASGTLSVPRQLAMQSWVALYCRPQNERTNEAAWTLAGRAVDDDADEPLGLACRAYAGFRAANYGWQGLPRDETVAAALHDVKRALSLAPEMHDGYFTQALLVHLGGEHGRAEELFRHCLRLVPDMAPAWGNLAYIRIVQGHPQEAAALCARAFDLSPCEPLRATWHWHLARAALDLGDAAAALAAAERAIAANPDLPGGYLCGVAAAHQLGRTELVARWLPWVAARPRYGTVTNVRRNYLGNSEANRAHRAQLADWLQAAGLPAS